MFTTACCLVLGFGLRLGLGLDFVSGCKFICTRICATLGSNCHGPVSRHKCGTYELVHNDVCIIVGPTEHSQIRFANNYTFVCAVQRLATVGEETLNTPVYVQVDSTRCHVMCDVTARYALIGRPSSTGNGHVSKLLRVAAFAPASVAPSLHYNLRVYCVDDTLDAVQVALY